MNPLDVLTLPLAGTHLVEASAGTGKTFAITNLVLRHLLERKLSLEQVLVVTFTRAATAELKQRLRRRIQQAAAVFADPDASNDEVLVALARASQDPLAARARLEQAILSADQASVMTIHGYCQRVLEEHAFETGMPFEVELVPDVRPMLRELVEDWWARTFADVSSAELDFAAEKGFDLRAAEALAAAAIAMPEMVVVGSSAPPTPVGAALTRYHELRGRLAREWAESKGEVASLLYAPGVLQGNRYRHDHVAQWLVALEGLVTRTGATYEGWFDKFEKFTPAALAAGTKKGARVPSHPFFSSCEALLAARLAADTALEQSLEHKKCALASWVRTELGLRKAEERIQTFDDLLVEVSRVLKGPRGAALSERLAGRHGAALIDEFQDTDPVQYEIFRRIYRNEGTSLFLVGDPKQAIYAFRGADIFAYLRAVEHTPPECRWTMATNWRSDPGLVAAVNYLFGTCERPFLLDGIEFREVNARPAARDQLEVDGLRAPPLEVLLIGAANAGAARGRLTKVDWASEQLPMLVAADLRQLLAGGARIAGVAVSAADVAVLTRTNEQASDVQRELRRLGIPSVLGGNASVLDSAEARALGAVLRAMARPGGDDWLWTALASEAFGLCAEELARTRSDAGAWEGWVERFAAWHDAWEGAGFMRAFRALTTELEVPGRLLATVGGERALTNWLHLGELLHQAASKQRLGMSALIEWFDGVRCDQDARRDIGAEDQQIRLESDASAVQLATMHRSKGLEYPVVYCPYLWEPAALRPGEIRHLLYHDPSDGLRLKLDIRPPDEKTAEVAQAKQERLAEYLRLTYVALTRARHQCRLVWGLFTGVESSPLAHLLHRGFRGRHGESGPDKLDEGRLREQLVELVRDSRGALGVRELRAAAVDPLVQREPSREWKGPRVFERRLRLELRTSSFSALTVEREGSTRASILGRDRDEVARGLEGGELPSPKLDLPSNLVGFPRGARSGELLHAILEHVDFVEPSGVGGKLEQTPELGHGRARGLEPTTEPAHERNGGFESVVREQMALHGFDYDEWGGSVCRCLQSMMAAPLDLDGGVCLGRVARSQRLSELEFILPVPTRAAEGLTPSALADAFEAEARDPVVRAYATEVRRLEFAPLSGFLRGFIDLVFELEGRWYVVDYKSNDLGDTAREYERGGLVRSMVGHHYVLQYHLYVLALHRYLEQRLPGYEYERDFGGAYYLFLRGLRPESSPRTGVWFDKPPLRLVLRLLAALGSGRADSTEPATGTRPREASARGFGAP